MKATAVSNITDCPIQIQPQISVFARTMKEKNTSSKLFQKWLHCFWTWNQQLPVLRMDSNAWRDQLPWCMHKTSTLVSRTPALSSFLKYERKTIYNLREAAKPCRNMSELIQSNQDYLHLKFMYMSVANPLIAEWLACYNPLHFFLTKWVPGMHHCFISELSTSGMDHFQLLQGCVLKNSIWSCSFGISNPKRTSHYREEILLIQETV